MACYKSVVVNACMCDYFHLLFSAFVDYFVDYTRSETVILFLIMYVQCEALCHKLCVVKQTYIYSRL